MYDRLLAKIKPFLKSLCLIALVVTFVVGNAGSALAARSGGRIGGGSFRAPTRTYSPPRGGYRSPGGYGYGRGIGFPFLLPFFGFGGFGSLFTILIFFAIANFLVNAVRNAGSQGGTISDSSNPNVSIAQVQVGLLADARALQGEFNELALKADTGTAEGRAMVLQEATLALLRHPEYWTYGAAETQQARLDSAEAKFNQYALAERSKFSAETLSNYNNQLREESGKNAIASAVSDLASDLQKESGEYLLVTLIVGATNRLQLPAINDSDDLRQALQQLGGIGSDRLLAVEVLWTPQAEGDVLTTNDLLAHYPNLKLV
ncbi:MAG: DUF1517 domain-containing protein [Cyanobacteriota bacterium]|nr:DUF1517 domain-containing protein [Cyanobacteriota bacterium]